MLRAPLALELGPVVCDLRPHRRPASSRGLSIPASAPEAQPPAPKWCRVGRPHLYPPDAAGPPGAVPHLPAYVLSAAATAGNRWHRRRWDGHPDADWQGRTTMIRRTQ